MAIQEVKGLEGLKGLNARTEADRYAYLNTNISNGKLPKGATLAMADRLYRNQLFVKEFGEEAFKSMDIAQRDHLYKETLAEKAFYQETNPFFDDNEGSIGVNGELYDKDKGLGRDFFKYDKILSADSKIALLQSDYLIPSKLNKKIEKEQGDISEIQANPLFAGTEGGASSIFAYNSLGKNLKETIDRAQNENIIQNLYNKDLKEKTNELDPIINQYYTENISQKSDDEIKSDFMKAIKPDEREGAAYIYSAYFNDDGTPKESEVDNFSIDDMRQFLAKKSVYDYYLGPEAGYDALNNQGKEYINDHQAWYTYTGLLARDIAISAASNTADKWNQVRRMTLLGREADVYLTNDGQVVPTANVMMDGNQAFYEIHGQRIPVHKQTLSLIALDDLGKDSNGEDRGWFNNAQFWTNAEQFGTLDEEELAQYKKLGHSPYKVAYKPGDDSDIIYESIKMTAFGLADMASNIMPVGSATIGAKAISQAAKMTGTMAKAMQIGGKTLYYTGKLGQKVTPTVGATAIGNAYGRGVFGETFAGNLQQLEQSVADQAQKEVYNLYTTNDEYKALVDADVEREYQELLSQYRNQLRANRGLSTDGRTIHIDNSNIPEFQENIRSQALNNVLNRRTVEWANNYKNSDMYGRALQEAVENASDAALTSSLTTAAKYVAVNYGWRKYLFKTPSELSASYNKESSERLAEITNTAGKKRLTSKFDFQGTKEFAKTLGSQTWGGAWTNATDELQSGGGRKINEDRMSQFISGMYNGRALDTRYSVMDGISSYLNGAVSALADANTYRAGLVGGLGSITSFTPNLTSLISTKNFKETWRNSSFGEKANMILANGILNNYYAKKQNQLQLKSAVDLVNKMLDETNDFEAIDQAIALDMASIDATNPEDANALLFLKAVQSIALLNNLKGDKEFAQIGQESSVIQKAISTIDKLSDPSTLTDEEKADFLTQYYAENPNTAQSETQNEMALQELQQRAIRLQEATETYSDIENTLNQVQKSRGTTLPNQVKARLIHRLTLDKFLTDRAAELEKRISGNSIPSSIESNIESYGTIDHQKSQIRATENLIKSIDKEITKAKDELLKAQKEAADYNSTPQNERDLTKESQLQNAINNSTIQVEYLNNINRELKLKLNRFNEQISSTSEESNGTKIDNRVISSSEILRLNPQDRARMLNPDNFDNYSDAQKVEITKLKNDLIAKNPSLLDDIQNQAILTQKIETNRNSYAMMLENPEAAAYQLESDMSRQTAEARAVNMDRIATKLADVIHKILQQGEYKGEDINSIRNSIYENLRVLNRDILEYIKDIDTANSLGLGSIFKEIQDAAEWSDIVTDIGHIIDSMKVDDVTKRAFTDNLDALLDKARSKAEVLDELGKVVESSDVGASTKVPYENLLNELEQLWNQRASTTSMTREERVTAREEYEKKLAEEEKRKKDAEEVARVEAEKKVTETSAAGITVADTNTSNDRIAELETQGLSEKDITINNEGSLTPEQIEQAVKESENINLESQSLDEQATTQSDKVNIRPMPTDDSTDQGNIQATSSGEYAGNTFYEYDINSLKNHGKQVKRKGSLPDDIMSKIFNWLETNGIRLQDIIDTELSDILKDNPNIYPMLTDMRPNITNDVDVSKTVFLTVEYNQRVNDIHNNELGGVITSNGKQYLIIGIMGPQRGNITQKGEIFEIMKDMQIKRKEAFDVNPSERFFVDRSRHTKVTGLTSGRLVRQLSTDTEVQIRNISELLIDKERNPKGLTMGDLKWGIQYNDRLETVNVSERNTVYPPSDTASNLGSVFLLVEAANGNYIPAYIRPIRLSELKEGKLQTQLDELINELTSTDYARRSASIEQLKQLLNLTQNGDDISIGTVKDPIVSIVKYGNIMRTFNLADVNFDRITFFESIKELDPRVNITTSTLSNVSSLEMFDEAGALTTDLAKLGTSGASYNVYAMDAEGNPIITTSVDNNTPTLEVNSDLVKSQRKLNSEKMGNATYRKDTNGNWYTETDKLVTDTNLIEQLNYRNLIRTRNLKPNKVIGVEEIFVINNDENNPLVLIRKGNQISSMSKESALKTINDVNTELAEKARQERLKEELETEVSNDKALETMSEEDKRKAIIEGEDVNFDLSNEQIEEQMIGDFKKEPTSQQKTVEESIERYPSNVSETIKAREDINETGTISLAELQNDKTGNTAMSIVKSKKFGKVARTLLKDKFPDMPSKTSELEKFLQSKGIATTGISNVEQWLKMIEECK